MVLVSEPLHAIALLSLPKSEDTWNPDVNKGHSLGRIGGRVKLLVLAIRGCGQILWVIDVKKTLGVGDLHRDWDNTVLHKQKKRVSR